MKLSDRIGDVPVPGADRIFTTGDAGAEITFAPGAHRVAQSIDGRIPRRFAISDVTVRDTLSEATIDVELVGFATVGEADDRQRIRIEITTLDVETAEAVLDELLPKKP